MQTTAASPAIRKTSSYHKTLSRATSSRPSSASKSSSRGRYVTIYLSSTLASHYEDQAAMFKTTVGKLIKERVEEKQLSFYDKMKKFIGTAQDLPSDLSTNPAYLADLGKDSIPLIKKHKK